PPNCTLLPAPLIETLPLADPVIPPPLPLARVKSPTPCVTLTIPPTDSDRLSTCSETLLPLWLKTKLPLICWLYAVRLTPIPAMLIDPGTNAISKLVELNVTPGTVALSPP